MDAWASLHGFQQLALSVPELEVEKALVIARLEQAAAEIDARYRKHPLQELRAVKKVPCTPRKREPR